MIRLSEADLRRAGYTVFGRDQYVVNWCGHGQEFITVPDTAGMMSAIDTGLITTMEDALQVLRHASHRLG